MKPLAFAAMLVLCGHGCASGQFVAPNAPPDRPVNAPVAEMDKAIAQLVAQARASYPQAKARFLAGLPSGERFFLVTRIYNSRGQMEQVFVLVRRIEGTQITGLLASSIPGVSEHREGQTYEFAEFTVIDWLIAKPDGSEEGNIVGNFLDTYKPKK